MSKTNENDASLGILPVLRHEKKYNFVDTLLVTSSYGIATWCYAQGAFMAEGLSFWQLLLSIFAPGIAVLAICCLLVVYSVKTGIDYWVWLKTLFGETGFKVICVLVVVMQVPWFAINANIFASSATNMLGAFGIPTPALFSKVYSLIPIALGGFIAVGGAAVMKWSSRVMVGALLLVAAILFVVAIRAVSVDSIINFAPETVSTRKYMLSTEACLGFVASWTTSLTVLPRLCKTQKGGYWGTFLSIGVVAPLFILLGGVLAIVMFLKTGVFESDIAKILVTLGGSGLSLLTLVIVFFANIGTAGVGTYSYGIVAKSAFPKLSFKMAILLHCVLTAVLAMTDTITAYFATYLSYSAYLYLAIMGLFFADFFIIRKQKISLRGIYGLDPNKPYRYTGGFNIVGFVCLVASFAAGSLIYAPMTANVLSPIFDYTTASFFVFVLSFVLYVLVNQIPAIKKYTLREG
ncbi:MAG: cytosine permease [Oscillospiraceae bacterium]|jgi:NCS1 family nucleobase:cation symporter-1|nr:cytosine permease [Oscillospiraceae bacterium]